MKNLAPVEFSASLTKLGACGEAATWAKNKSLSEVWATCRRGDWLLWLIARYGDAPRKTAVAIACDVAETASAFTTDPRPAECLAVVRRWLKDEATIDEVRAAARAAESAESAARAARAAAREKSLQFSADVCRKYIQVEE